MNEYISLCVLSYNRREFLERTLKSIWENTVGPYELLVHDDGSSDDIREYLFSLLKSGQISYLVLNRGKNSGVGKSLRNLLEIASGRYLIKLDQDLIFTKSWDQQVIRIMDTFSEIGSLGLFKYYHDPVDHNKMYIETLERNNLKVEIVTDYVGSCLVIRPELYKKIGFGVHSAAFAEDVAFKQEIQKRGLKLGLPLQDIATNLGFGVPNSTVVYQEKGDLKVTKIHKEPLLFKKE